MPIWQCYMQSWDSEAIWLKIASKNDFAEKSGEDAKDWQDVSHMWNQNSNLNH